MVAPSRLLAVCLAEGGEDAVSAFVHDLTAPDPVDRSLTVVIVALGGAYEATKLAIAAGSQWELGLLEERDTLLKPGRLWVLSEAHEVVTRSDGTVCARPVLPAPIGTARGDTVETRDEAAARTLYRAIASAAGGKGLSTAVYVLSGAQCLAPTALQSAAAAGAMVLTQLGCTAAKAEQPEGARKAVTGAIPVAPQDVVATLEEVFGQEQPKRNLNRFALLATLGDAVRARCCLDLLTLGPAGLGRVLEACTNGLSLEELVNAIRSEEASKEAPSGVLDQLCTQISSTGLRSLLADAEALTHLSDALERVMRGRSAPFRVFCGHLLDQTDALLLALVVFWTGRRTGSSCSVEIIAAVATPSDSTVDAARLAEVSRIAEIPDEFVSQWFELGESPKARDALAVTVVPLEHHWDRAPWPENVDLVCVGVGLSMLRCEVRRRVLTRISGALSLDGLVWISPKDAATLDGPLAALDSKRCVWRPRGAPTLAPASSGPAPPSGAAPSAGVSDEDTAPRPGAAPAISRATQPSASSATPTTGDSSAPAALLTVPMLTEGLDALPYPVALIDERGQLMHGNSAWSYPEIAGHGPEADANERARQARNYLDTLRDSSVTELRGAERSVRALLNGAHDVVDVPYVRSDAQGAERPTHRLVVRKLHSAAVAMHLPLGSVLRADQPEGRLASLLDAMEAPIALVDAESLRISTANAAFLRRLGRPADVIVGASFRLFIHEEEVESLSEAVARALSATDEAEPVFVRTTLASAGRRSERVRIRLRSAMDAVTTDESASGTPNREVFFILDASATSSDTADVSSHALSATRMEALGNLAGGVAHELNNVLTAVMSIASVWSESEELTEEFLRDVDDVMAACRRGRDVTRNLLTFARTDTAPHQPLNLVDVVEEVMALIRKTAPKNVVISTFIRQQELVVNGNRSELGQALMNLCINAFDALDGSGELVVELTARPSPNDEASTDAASAGCALLQVRDNGPGMPEEVRARIFEPFFSTKPKDRGTGLGLPMVLGLARASGGTVHVDTKLGEGTSITVALPLLDQPPRPRTERLRTLPRMRGHLLLVDDDHLVRRGVRRVLESAGFDITEAPSASAAEDLLNLAQSGDAPPIVAALVDVVMPGRSGLQLLESIRRRHGALPVVLYSGYADVRELSSAELDDQTTFVRKPIEIDRLIEEIVRLLPSIPSGRPPRTETH